jgi:hypothetical protein
VAQVNDIIHTKRQGWLLFVDFSKAYDSVDREALLTILKAYKFDRTIVSFIRMSMLPYKIFSEQLGIEFLVERGVPQFFFF